MIIYFLLFVLLALAQQLFLAVGFATDQLPWGLDAIMVTAVGYYKTFEYIFPPIGIVFTATMIYLGFKGIMLVMKLVLGARAPVQAD